MRNGTKSRELDMSGPAKTRPGGTTRAHMGPNPDLLCFYIEIMLGGISWRHILVLNRVFFLGFWSYFKVLGLILRFFDVEKMFFCVFWSQNRVF